MQLMSGPNMNTDFVGIWHVQSKLNLTLLMRSVFCYRRIGMDVIVYIPSSGTEFYSFLLFGTDFFFGTHVPQADNWSSAAIYSTG